MMFMPFVQIKANAKLFEDRNLFPADEAIYYPSCGNTFETKWRVFSLVQVICTRSLEFAIHVYYRRDMSIKCAISSRTIFRDENDTRLVCFCEQVFSRLKSWSRVAGIKSDRLVFVNHSWRVGVKLYVPERHLKKNLSALIS